jgi:hypothetical protein
MAIKLFGFTISREEDDPTKLQSFAQEENEDGALQISPLAGAYGTYLDIEGAAKNEAEVITRYREMVQYPECEYAVDDIVNETIVTQEERGPISIILDQIDQPQAIKIKIENEFKEILSLLDFKNHCYDTFRRWYVDGRLYYHIIINVDQPKKGIQELRYIDPRKIRKVKQIKKTGVKAGAGQTIPVAANGAEYYMYNERGLDQKGGGQGIKIAKDSVCYTHSGLLDARKAMIVSHLHKAIKPYNQLKMLEDAVVIYRIARAPERRIFYVDVGNLPKIKAEQYLRDIMTKFKNRLVYNSGTGEVSDEREHRTMLEDYWLPRREGGRGTEITTLPGGQNLGEIDDILYFRKKLYRAMNVPMSRLEPEAGFNIGRSAEITRDEVKFGKFVARLRNKFSQLFLNLLETQLRLKGVLTADDWEKLRGNIYFHWMKDTHFMELQEAEVARNRIELLRDMEEFKGVYFSKEWLRKTILRQTEEDIKIIDNQIKKEGAEEEDDNMGELPPDEGPGSAPAPQKPAPGPQREPL